MQDLARARRLLILSLAIAGLGILFFLLHGSEPRTAPLVSEQKGNDRQVAAAATPHARRYIDGPDPQTFTRFTAHVRDGSRHVTGTCTADYATVMVYPVAVDYRESPLDAIYNMADACPSGGTYERTIILADYPFVENTDYYIIRADQGVRGAWYNPH